MATINLWFNNKLYVSCPIYEILPCRSWADQLAYDMGTDLYGYVLQLYDRKRMHPCIFYRINRKYFERIRAVYVAVENEKSLFFTFHISLF